jgi:purine catabolism regulator
MELERMWSRREELRRLGSETLAQLVEGRSIQGSAELLERLGVTSRPLVLLAVSSTEEPDSIGDLHNTLADECVPNLLLQRGEALYALVEGHSTIAAKFTGLLPTDSRIGVSAPFDDPAEAPTALQQAKWALGATSEECPVAHHGQAASLFGPRSPGEAQMTVDEILGTILDYDQEHGTELLHSLRVFLQCNRSWKRATAELFVHKQTLVYRIQRVEQMTGRKLTDTGDVAELWLALRAYEMLA